MYPQIPPLVKLIAIDPGSRHCGISFFTIDFINKKIIRIESKTIHPDTLVNDTGLSQGDVPDYVIRHYKLRNAILRELKEFQPDYIAYEGPFFNSLQPSAFGSLMATMTIIRDCVYEYRIGLPFTVMQPSVVKMAVSVAGKKGKEIVVEALKKIDEIMNVLVTDIDSLDDNGVDSIAVGYAFVLYHIQKSNESLPVKGKKNAKSV